MAIVNVGAGGLNFNVKGDIKDLEYYYACYTDCNFQLFLQEVFFNNLSHVLVVKPDHKDRRSSTRKDKNLPFEVRDC